jgi:hypothetical protein
MKRKNNLIGAILLMICSLSYGQMDEYQYKRSIDGVREQWHAIPLPDSIFGKTSTNLSDIRIYGVGKNNDTIEVPYLLRIKSEKIKSEAINFNIVNTSHNENGYYYTFELPAEITINQIKLDFKVKNFDWKIALEGSNEQQEWFTILNDYRILSIQNGLTDYKFTSITLPNSKFRFFRLLIKSDNEPNLEAAQIYINQIIDGSYKNFPIKTLDINVNKTEKTTDIMIDLGSPLPISSVVFEVKDEYDYYRQIKISQITDSIRTGKGWKYNYSSLFSGILSSLEDNNLVFGSTIVQKFKVTIYNGDNQPLTYENIEVKGFQHDLTARFTEEASYYLTYGNNNAPFPNYDIAKFSNNIPENLLPLRIGQEQSQNKKQLHEIGPIFKNEAWLWGIISLIIIVLGWFSLNMIRKKG